jgi:hypothetical protein
MHGFNVKETRNFNSYSDPLSPFLVANGFFALQTIKEHNNV